jgi:hypothetical protein
MTEEKKILGQKLLKTKFVGESELPPLFVNVANVRAGLEEFYLTFGATSPVEVADIDELNRIDSVDAKPFFRCVLTRSTMKQLIDLLESVYNQQTEQIESFRQLHEQEGKN